MANSTNHTGHNSDDWSLYPYDPNKVLPIVFGVLVLISGSLHLYQSFIKFKWQRFGFFMIWGSSVWIAGFVTREISAYLTQNVDMYICQVVLILAGPPIYAAAEYFVLGRLLFYLPYYAPLHPGRTTSFFILLGAAVESLSANGAAKLANSSLDSGSRQTGAHLLEASLILQATVELGFLSIVATVFHRCRKAGNMPPNVRNVCIMLCGTSTLVLARCIFRIVESFQAYSCNTYLCGPIAHHEWYLWVFEVAVMTVYVYWLNWFHPGTLLPGNPQQYLHPDGTQRIGPGWVDDRHFILTVIDPFNLGGCISRRRNHTQEHKFWEDDNPLAKSQWPGTDMTKIKTPTSGTTDDV